MEDGHLPKGIPPDEDRCQGVYGAQYRQRPELRGQRCELPTRSGADFCLNHSIPDERRCTAHYSASNPDPDKVGKRCPCWARKGLAVCGSHGGATTRAKTAAKLRELEEKAWRTLKTYGQKKDTTATEALLEEVKWTAGHVAWLRERVQEIEASAEAGYDQNGLVWGVVRRKTGGEDRGVTEEATASIWLKLYQIERAHLIRVCSEAIRAGIEERRVKLAEEHGALLAQVIRAVLDDLSLTPEQQARVSEVVPRHLRAVAG